MLTTLNEEMNPSDFLNMLVPLYLSPPIMNPHDWRPDAAPIKKKIKKKTKLQRESSESESLIALQQDLIHLSRVQTFKKTVSRLESTL